MQNWFKTTETLKLFSIGVFYLLIFHLLFGFFQSADNYQTTLGKISSNYERKGGWNEAQIVRVKTPFVERSDDNYLNWDAAIYYCIAQRLYKVEDSCYGNVRAAFFPAFPLLWKATGLSPRQMAIFNFLVFSFALALIFSHFSKLGFVKSIPGFLILISLPTSIIFHLPYTEAFFVLGMVIGFIGFKTSKYWLYFLGFCFMAAVRPATVFVLLAIAVVDFLYAFQKKMTFVDLARNLFKRAFPFAIGYVFALSLQVLSSGKINAFWNAHQYWKVDISDNWQILDWSTEGFGMNVFALFFISIPALLAVFYYLRRIDLSETKNYILAVSLFYLTGIFIFTLLTSGGNLHSFFRFQMASPCFFLVAVFLLENNFKISIRRAIYLFVYPFAAMLVFFWFVSYGGNRIRFEYFGTLMLVFSYVYTLVQYQLQSTNRYLALTLIILGNIIWSTYLLNMFLSNVWIFT